MKSTGFDLNAMQRWLQEVITHLHPGSVLTGVASPQSKALSGQMEGQAGRLVCPSICPESIVMPSKNLSSSERLGIYGSIYFERLVKCLEVSYPALVHALGTETFREIAKKYIVSHPSTNYGLNDFGAHLPNYLKDEAENLPVKEFLFSIATLERTIQIVFDERQEEPLSVDKLKALQAEHRAKLRFKTIPALRLLDLEYPANAFLQAVYDKDESPIKIPAPCKSYLVVFRSKYHVCRLNLDLVRFVLLSALNVGKALSEAVESCASIAENEPGTLTSASREWIEEWTEDGIFYAVD